MTDNIIPFERANSQYEELENELELIKDDPALWMRWKARNPRLWAIMLERAGAEEPALETFGPLPMEFAAIQVSIFDNWPEGVKPNRYQPTSRYGVEVRVWAEVPGSKAAWNAPSWDGECRNLWEAREVKAKVKRHTKRTLKCPISPIAASEIIDRASSAEMAGFLAHKFRKSHTEFFEGHYVLLSMRDGDPVVALETPNLILAFEGFTDRLANGKAVRSANPNCVGQVRFSTDPALTGNRNGWTSGSCVSVEK